MAEPMNVAVEVATKLKAKGYETIVTSNEIATRVSGIKAGEVHGRVVGPDSDPDEVVADIEKDFAPRG